MQKKFKPFALLTTVVIFLSFSSSHPVGRSGAPGDGLCSNCHGGSASFSGSVELSGLPSTLSPGENYDITMEVSFGSGSPVRGGFQVVALSDQDNSQAGIWSNADNFSSLKTSGGRVYFGHQPSRNFNSNTSVSWEAEWEVPDINNTITFYMVGLIANGNGSTSGDEVVTNQLTVEVISTETLEVDFEDITAVSCEGDSDGSVTAVVSGGEPPYTYLWDNGEDTAMANDLNGGSHFITVTDDNGEQVIEDVIIPEPSEIDADIFVTDISCFGNQDGNIEVNAFGGTGNLECNWSSLGNGCNQSDLEADIYFLSITDENNCLFETEIEIEEPAELILNMFSEPASISNNDGTATCETVGGTAPFEFIWSNGQIFNGLSSTITGLAQGQYSVTVSDANGCTRSDMVTVEGPSCDISLVLIASDVTCFSDSTGAIGVNISGATPPVSFQWSDGSTNDGLMDVPAGDYTVTVSDAASCTAVASTIITQPDSLYIDSLSLVDNECSLDVSGEIAFTVQGGTAPYQLNWSTGVSNDTLINGLDTLINIPDTLSGLLSGTYFLSITDNNNCMLIDSFFIDTKDSIAPVINCNNADIIINSCDDFEYSQPVATDNCGIDRIEQVNGLASGSSFPEGTSLNTFRAYDTAGNSAECSFSITLDSDLEVEIDAQDANCAESNGSITLNVSGGTPPYEVSPDLLTDLAAGNYMISVTDATGCFYEESVFIGQLGISFNYDIVTTDVSCKGGSDGAIDVILSNTDPLETYVITIDDGANSSESLNSGEHFFTIEELGTGCLVNEVFTIQEPDQELNQEVLDFNLDPCTMLLIDSERLVTGGTSPYQLEEQQSSSNIIFIAVDANGCIERDTVDAMIPDEFLFVNLIDITDSSNGSNGSIEVQAGGGVPPYSFIWLNETGEVVGTESILDGIGSGTYTLIVSDAAGCELAPSSFVIDMISSIDDLENSASVQIFPNPAIDFVKLRFVNEKPEKLSLVSLNGQKIIELIPEGSQDEIDVSDLLPGIYIIRFEYSNGFKTSPLVKY